MKIIKVHLMITGLLFWLTACSTVKPEIQPTYTPYPTYMPLPTYTLCPTNEVYPTYTLYPTLALYPTYTPYPKPTEIPIATKPAVTNTPEPSVNPELTTDKKAGVWLVGSEVAAGQWRASGNCYAVTKDKQGKPLDMANGTRSIMSVPADAYTVEFVSYPGSCTWSYLGQ